MTTPPDRSPAPSTEAARDAAQLRATPDRVDADAAVDLVRAHLADGVFLDADDAEGRTAFEAAVERYRRHGLAGLLQPLLDRVGALCALNPRWAPAFARHGQLISVAESPSPYFVAGTARYRDGSSLILFDSGLFHTLWEIAQLVCGTLPSGADDPTASVSPDEAQALLTLHRASHRLLGGSRFGTQLVLTPRTAQAAALLVDGAHLFVLAHEVAHVLLQHSPRTADAPPPLDRAGIVDSVEVDELAADIVAFHIVTEDLRRAGNEATFSDVLFRVGGARLVFDCISMIEQQAYVLPARSHPPPQLRWDVVRNFAVEGFGATTTARIESLWVPYDAISERAATGAPSVDALVDGYRHLLDRGGLLDAPLSPDVLRTLLTRACATELEDNTPGAADVDAVAADLLPRFSTAKGLTWRQLHRAVSNVVSGRDADADARWAQTARIARRLQILARSTER